MPSMYNNDVLSDRCTTRLSSRFQHVRSYQTPLTRSIFSLMLYLCMCLMIETSSGFYPFLPPNKLSQQFLSPSTYKVQFLLHRVALRQQRSLNEPFSETSSSHDSLAVDDGTAEQANSTKLGNEIDEGLAAKPKDGSKNFEEEEEEEPFTSEPGVEFTSTGLITETKSFRTEQYILTTAAIVGLFSGLSVAVFKLSIEQVRQLFYGSIFSELFPVFIIPAIGGIAVSFLAATGDFPPGLRGAISEVDEDSLNSNLTVEKRSNEEKEGRNTPIRFLRKTLAAVCTLGTGNSLGPEGPSVEVGMAVSRILMVIQPPATLFGERGDDLLGQLRQNRLLLSCGAAAGVSAGFNAPLSGIFFALEIVQKALPPVTLPVKEGGEMVADPSDKPIIVQRETLASETGFITAILLSSVISALISQEILGQTLALSLSTYELKTPLIELPLYMVLGALSGVVAAVFSSAAQLSKSFFQGKAGPPFVQKYMRDIPSNLTPVIGGLVCGMVGVFYPQILFFGYETLNGLLAADSFSTQLLLKLLLLKTFTTALSVGSGLVGGTFAPSLFLGGMTGAAFHNVVSEGLVELVKVLPFGITLGPDFGLAEVPAYAMVGAASVLASLFRSPLTASLLLFESTRDYEVILPLLASAGVASLVGDVVEKVLEERRRDIDHVSWGALADDDNDKCQ